MFRFAETSSQNIGNIIIISLRGVASLKIIILQEFIIFYGNIFSKGSLRESGR